MKTIFDEGTKAELINRIDSLKENAPITMGQNECVSNGKTLPDLGRNDAK